MVFEENGFFNLCLQYDAVYIYGAGRNALKLYEILNEHCIQVSGFYVSSMDGNPASLFDLPVMPIESFMNDGSALIIISVTYEREPVYSQIKNKLQELGVADVCTLSNAFYKYFQEKKEALLTPYNYYSYSSFSPAALACPDVTLILPSLNSAKYIAETLDSVCGQSLEDIEILCIDSGSTDGTLDIIKQYAAEDERIRLIEFPKKSYGAQMNCGIREARGKYIGIVETDDYIAPEMCQELYEHAVRYRADFVKADFLLFTDRLPQGRFFLNAHIPRPILDNSGCYSRKDYLNSALPDDAFIWAGIYQRSWLLENNIVFQETPGAAFQDYGFRYQAACAARRAFFLEKTFYRYRRDNDASSMWSGKATKYNYDETAFLVRIARERAWPREYLASLTRYFVRHALFPTLDTLFFSQPNIVIKESIEDFRLLFQKLLNTGYLSPEITGDEEYFLARMLIESPAECFTYLFHREELRMGPLMKLLDTLGSKKEIVLCGDEPFYSRTYATLRANGIDTVSAIASYAPPPEATWQMGLPLDFPETIVPRYPNAHYVVLGEISSTSYARSRLNELGVHESKISEFNMELNPFRCFNPSLRSSSEYRRVFEAARKMHLF